MNWKSEPLLSVALEVTWLPPEVHIPSSYSQEVTNKLNIFTLLLMNIFLFVLLLWNILIQISWYTSKDFLYSTDLGVEILSYIINVCSILIHNVAVG